MSDKANAPGEDFLDPWDRQSGEPSKAYAVFCVYRDLGVRRSLRLACKQFYLSDYTTYKLRYCQEWSRHWEWVRRVAAWDAHLDRESRIVQAESVREMNRRYANAARALLGKAVQGLQRIRPDEMDATEVARLMELANKIERLCHGEATEHHKQDVKAEGSVVLEVVERIVPVRSVEPEPEPTALPPAAKALTAAAEPEGEFELPDEPPPGV